MKKKIGLLFGDCGGVGPEIVAKTLAQFDEKWIPVLIGPLKIINPLLRIYAPNIIAILNTYDENEYRVQLIDIPCKEIPIGEYSAEAGKNLYESLSMAAALASQKKLDGILFAPHSSKSLKLAGVANDEIEMLEKVFAVKHVGRVVKHYNVLRANVVGDCPFKDIFGKITEEGILQTGEDLIEALKLFDLEKKGIAVSALNPHRGDGGLFGDEEEWLDKVVSKYAEKHPDLRIEGTFAPDSLLIRGVKGQEVGLLYLHINQGEISMTTWAYGEETPIYTGLPCPVMSTEFTAKISEAGKGTADPINYIYSLKQMLLCLEK